MITKFEPKESGLRPYRKEKHFYRQVSAVQHNGYETLKICFYRTSTPAYYCCIWLYKSPIFVQAGAKDDGGMGYNHEESALRNALRKLGIEFSNTSLDVYEVCKEISAHLGIETIIVDAKG